MLTKISNISAWIIVFGTLVMVGCIITGFNVEPDSRELVHQFVMWSFMPVMGLCGLLMVFLAFEPDPELATEDDDDKDGDEDEAIDDAYDDAGSDVALAEGGQELEDDEFEHDELEGSEFEDDEFEDEEDSAEEKGVAEEGADEDAGDAGDEEEDDEKEVTFES